MLVTGMVIGTLFTLFVVPSIYMLVARRHSAEASVEAAEREVRAHPPQVHPSPV
jgi:multidrug efflux pump